MFNVVDRCFVGRYSCLLEFFGVAGDADCISSTGSETLPVGRAHGEAREFLQEVSFGIAGDCDVVGLGTVEDGEGGTYRKASPVFLAVETFFFDSCFQVATE